MPLRVAEHYAYIFAVNKCCECPHVEARRSTDRTEILGWECNYRDKPMQVADNCIPVWCPLPAPGGLIFTGVDMGVKEGDRTVKMRGRHPENIVWDDERPQPIIFMVMNVETEGMDTYITIEPALARDPDYTCLRKGNCLVTYTEKSVIRFWVAEKPTSSRLKITPGGTIEEGDRLTLVTPQMFYDLAGSDAEIKNA